MVFVIDCKVRKIDMSSAHLMNDLLTRRVSNQLPFVTDDATTM